MRSSLSRVGPFALVFLLALLVLPASALATSDDLKQAVDGTLGDTVPINTMWVVIAAIFVLLMQAGFAMLEIGFSRGKNAGTGVAKILTNLSIAAICYWAVGFAFAFGSKDVLGISSQLIGSNGFFLQFSRKRRRGLPSDGRVGRAGRVEVPVPVRVLRGLPGDRLGLDARADQVRRLRDLRDRVRVDHLPDRLALGVRRRLAPER